MTTEHQMTTEPVELRNAASVLLAPPEAENHPLKIVQFRARREKKPVSERRYTSCSYSPRESLRATDNAGQLRGRKCCSQDCRNGPWRGRVFVFRGCRG